MNSRRLTRLLVGQAVGHQPRQACRPLRRFPVAQADSDKPDMAARRRGADAANEGRVASAPKSGGNATDSSII
jgi:hypothetical protein